MEPMNPGLDPPDDVRRRAVVQLDGRLLYFVVAPQLHHVDGVLCLLFPFLPIRIGCSDPARFLERDVDGLHERPTRDHVLYPFLSGEDHHPAARQHDALQDDPLGVLIRLMIQGPIVYLVPHDRLRLFVPSVEDEVLG